jgi:hypothetical protein
MATFQLLRGRDITSNLILVEAALIVHFLVATTTLTMGQSGLLQVHVRKLLELELDLLELFLNV